MKTYKTAEVKHEFVSGLRLGIAKFFLQEAGE